MSQSSKETEIKNLVTYHNTENYILKKKWGIRGNFLSCLYLHIFTHTHTKSDFASFSNKVNFTTTELQHVHTS